MAESDQKRGSRGRELLLRWLTLALSLATYVSILIFILINYLESWFFDSWGKALRESDLEMVFLYAAILLELASLISFVAVRHTGRGDAKNAVGGVLAFPVFLAWFVMILLPSVLHALS
ncbi:MAG: hypothetical protein ACYTKD_22190 [Planctomycetota bacterium]|jgi:hypothetical protein